MIPKLTPEETENLNWPVDKEKIRKAMKAVLFVKEPWLNEFTVKLFHVKDS